MNRMIKMLVWTIWGMVISAGIIGAIIQTSAEKKIPPPITYKDCEEFVMEAKKSDKWPYVEIVPNRKLSNPGHVTAIALKTWLSYIDWEAYRPRRLGPRDPRTQNYLISPTSERWLTK